MCPICKERERERAVSKPATTFIGRICKSVICSYTHTHTYLLIKKTKQNKNRFNKNCVKPTLRVDERAYAITQLLFERRAKKEKIFLTPFLYCTSLFTFFVFYCLLVCLCGACGYTENDVGGGVTFFVTAKQKLHLK